MRKIVFPILVLLLVPMITEAVDEVVFDADTTIEFSDGSSVVIKDGSIADQVVVNPSNIQITLSSGSSVTITDSNSRIMDNTLGIVSSCAEGDYSTTVLPSQSTVAVVTVTPLNQTCRGGSESIGGDEEVISGGSPTPITPSVPSTNTGQITVDPVAGGETTLTTDEDTTAGVTLPVDAVGVSTVVQITSQSKDVIVDSHPVPVDKNIVGSYVYNYTATAGEESVSAFDEDVTISLSYTEEQISNLEEATLKIYYWDNVNSEWVGLSTLIFAATNILTATVDHFTYFVIFGSLIDENVEDIDDGVTVNEGDMIRDPNAEGIAPFDIYIVKMVGDKKFKRLILSPHVFESYGHLEWGDVKDVGQSTMDQYITSDLVRAQGDAKVYELTPTGDTGTKQWLDMTVTEFESSGYDWDSIYVINTTDRDAYTTGTSITE